MSGQLFSSSWYRVAELQPRLRSHAEISRHQYRGQTWYVLADRSNERFHRFSPEAYSLIGLMDGRRTVAAIWETACSTLGDDAPTQDEVIDLLARLHAADVLQCDAPPDATELLERHQRFERNRWRARLFSLFSWRFPLVDPDAFLRASLPFVRPLIGSVGALLWLAVVVPATVLLAMHWTDFTKNFLDRVATPHNFVLLWFLFPAVKTLHELGHAYVTRAYGGEVHEMGVMLLVLTPVPYVDASATWAFPAKWRRIVVGAAGMLVELFLAALAMFVWVSVEPGTLRVLAFNTILIAGISTVLFNANPLLRYDGYYMLADLLEIPNLRPRGNTYLGYLCERYLFARRDAEPPMATRGERIWFVVYGVTAFVYRVFVVVAIILYLGDHFFMLAVAFAAIGAIGWIGVPLAKGLAFLFKNPRLRSVRARAIATTAAIVGVVGCLIGVVPVPFRSRAEGVIWIPEESLVRAKTEGFVERVVAIPGTRVRRGDVLLQLADPLLSAKVRELSARRVELQARYEEQRPIDRVKAEIIKEELEYVTHNLVEAQRRFADLTIRSGADGIFVAPDANDLPGRFVKQGNLLGYAVELGTVTVRAVVPQGYIDLVTQRTRRIDVRLAERLGDVVPAAVLRVVPGGSERLPTTALGSEGGGQIAVDPRDQHGVTAVAKVFQVDLELPRESHVVNAGGRAYVRFDHGWSPLAVQWYEEARRLFLSRFNV